MTTAQITAANFNEYKVRIVNSCSTFGNVNHPETWATSLCIFEFDEVAEDMASELLINLYYSHLKLIKL
jgi:hypothetical protein